MKPGLHVADIDGEPVTLWGPSRDGTWWRLSDHGTASPIKHGTQVAARPLVKLDAEDGADVERVSQAFRVSQGHASDGLLALTAAAPDEPLALGAVVPLHDGGHAVRIASLPSWRTAWALVDAVGMPGDCCLWSEVVLMIEPGWTQ